jgi:hypothetical protein
LTLDGGFSPLENLLGLPSSVRELYIEYVSLPVIYTALQKLGPGLTKLQFKKLNAAMLENAPIDLYRVLATCPKLQSFQFLCGRPVLARDISEFAFLPSDYFQNFKRFVLAPNLSLVDWTFSFILFRFGFTGRKFDDGDATRQAELLNLFSMFLLGSTEKWKLDVASDKHQLDVVSKVLKDNPACLDRLEEIEVDLYNFNEVGNIISVSMQMKRFTNLSET